MPSPRPETPNPRRFQLYPQKRAQPHPQQATPLPPPLPPPPPPLPHQSQQQQPQFQSTPKFGSSSTVERLSAARRRQYDFEEVDEIVDQSSADDQDEHVLDDDDGDGGSDGYSGDARETPSRGNNRSSVRMIDVESYSKAKNPTATHHDLGDLDIESSIEVQDHAEEAGREHAMAWDAAGAHSPSHDRMKRRKHTLSPEREWLVKSRTRADDVGGTGEDTPPTPSHCKAHDGEGDDVDERTSHRRDRSPLQMEPSYQDQGHISEDEQEEEDEISAFHAAPAEQPIFQPPPRFKAVSPSIADSGLPFFFSPQRRGAKYLPNGLAATLQAQLSEVKGWDETMVDSGDGSSSQQDRQGGHGVLAIRVAEVRAGSNMYLVQGRQSATGSEGDQGTSVGEARKFILAGEGTLAGLGRRADVVPGCVVELRPPVWDVELLGAVWLVACAWTVQ